MKPQKHRLELLDPAIRDPIPPRIDPRLRLAAFISGGGDDRTEDVR